MNNETKRNVNRNDKGLMQFIASIIVTSLLLGQSSPVFGAAPVLKMKAGMSDLAMDAGDRLKGQKLQSLVTLQPSVLWNVPSFSSQFGVHFLSELNSPYGATPISGIGLSAYYYLFGLSSAYEQGVDDVLIQKSRPGPYLFAAFTPVNVNLNKLEASDTSQNFYFSAYVNDLMIGPGYEYPLMQNTLLSAEFVLRSGTSIQSGSEKIGYTGWSFFLNFSTTYF